ncbi:hypothetical protein [Mycobacterium uberis]|uniref:hypothetical protein n=1 Tax=Mycobacterium uberis TaxID=2162698 RepID=UPI001FB29D11|nr:hypothetical protein [Mycobacterium uberis]
MAAVPIEGLEAVTVGFANHVIAEDLAEEPELGEISVDVYRRKKAQLWAYSGLDLRGWQH